MVTSKGCKEVTHGVPAVVVFFIYLDCFFKIFLCFLNCGGFISLTPEVEYGPDGVALSGPYTLSVDVGNGQVIDITGELGSGIPQSGYNTVCFPCYLFFFL